MTPAGGGWRRRPPAEAPPAFLFFGAISRSLEVLNEVGATVVDRFGALCVGGTSEVFEFPETRTYRDSMGSGLKRRFYVIEKRWPQDGLAPVKHAAVAMEEDLRARFDLGVPRPANIDPGLVNDCRVLLASTKDHAHRMYRGAGIWEEVTLVYRHGAYRPLPWTYPDFHNPAYHEFFLRFRRLLLDERGRQRSTGW